MLLEYVELNDKQLPEWKPNPGVQNLVQDNQLRLLPSLLMYQWGFIRV